jgi:4'-phosphopantetheinyl transferase
VSAEGTWGEPPPNPGLAARQVDVWRASLDPPAPVVAALAGTLAGDERARAERYRLERDRRRFTVGRGLLRAILTRYLGGTPDALRFRYGPLGKPALVEESGGGAGPGDLTFSVSHSADLALYAVARARRVGVDVERLREDLATGDLARRFFSPAEAAAIASLGPALRTPAFFRCWTRKEAYVKARGEGLSVSLESFDVSLRPDEPAALVASREDPREPSRWALVDLPVGPGAVAALAVEGREVTLRLWRWPQEAVT